jgi:predicted pyridoxine 5'-phosphate oxidase superfamily flavin-nucleotide-binding protein
VIPPGAGPFLAAQRLAALAGINDAGQVWASLVTGRPGFISAPDDKTLHLAAGLAARDPLAEGLAEGRPLGVLVLDPERRRRIRLNGRAGASPAGGILVRIEEVFGNCPKYIQARAPEGDAAPRHDGVARRGATLSEAQRLAIERTDTFFIASVHGEVGADASHRGGRPGFVRVDSERRLRFPDYAGNNMFQTLGNLATDPRVGLLFPDFDTGTTLQLTGRARIIWAREELADLAGAERAVDLEVDEVVEIEGAGPLGWRFLDYSPFNPR